MSDPMGTQNTQVQYAGAPQAPAKTGTDGFAIAAFIFGILGGLLAFVFGPMALNRIKKSGQGGRGLAIAGMVIAAVVIVINIIVMVAAQS